MTTIDSNRWIRGTVLGAVLAAGLAWVGLDGQGGPVPDAAAEATAVSSWKIANPSQLTLLGAVRAVKEQTIGTGPGTAPKNWNTLSNLVLPKVPLAFGQSIEFLQNGTAQGVINSLNGQVTLDLPLLLRDPTGATQTFTAYLTTGQTNGVNSDGGPVCDGTSHDPSVCRGTPLDASRNFRMVAIVNIPQQGNTLGSGSELYLEISGSLSLTCSGTVCTASDSCHLAGTCDPATGMCSNPVKPNGSACSDGNACTQTDTCQAGVCTASNPVVCTASDSCHLSGTCNPETGVCSAPVKANGASCNDGSACTRNDTCQAGVCTGANPVVCAAPDQCHDAGTCNPGSGVCSRPSKANGTACSDANACTQTDTCQAGTCTGANPVVCAASDQCHKPGTCSTTTGVCTNPTKSNGTTCNDANGCTRSDTCQSGVCTGTNPLVCTASDQCHNVGTCSPETGTCSNPAKTNGTTCNDANACTRSDSCQAGTCTGTNPVVCAASDQCHAIGTCSTATGICSNPVKPNGTACADANLCTQNETCQSGTCTSGSPVVCTASDQCHNAGSCSPTTGCSNPAKTNGTSCSDGNACTRSDTCQAGSCIGANPLVCTTGDQCHGSGMCNSTTGLCVNPAKPNGTACDDGDPCTQTDTCTNGSCAGVSGSPAGETLNDLRLGKDAGTTRIEWSSASGATLFDVARGLLSGLPVGAGEGERCLGSGVSGTTTTDDEAPPVGDGFWYLVRGNSSCPQGSYGFEQIRGTSPALRATAICQSSCRTVEDCPGAGSECKTPVCAAGTCGFTFTSAGAVVSHQLPGDCRRNVCDGSGGVAGVDDDTDVPVDGDPCTQDLCTHGGPSHPPAPAGTRCAQGGGSVCDATGACVQCITAADCPGADTDCATRTCGLSAPGVCGFSFAPSGTATSTQRAGDCRRSVCDGSGSATSVVDDADLPSDGNSCTRDVCTNGTPSNPPQPSGTACSSGVCDGNGSCGVCGGTVQRCCSSYPYCRPGLSCQSGLCR